MKIFGFDLAFVGVGVRRMGSPTTIRKLDNRTIGEPSLQDRAVVGGANTKTPSRNTNNGLEFKSPRTGGDSASRVLEFGMSKHNGWAKGTTLLTTDEWT